MMNRNSFMWIDLRGVRLSEEDMGTGVAALYLSQKNSQMFISLIKQLREDTDIKIFSDLL